MTSTIRKDLPFDISASFPCELNTSSLSEMNPDCAYVVVSEARYLQLDATTAAPLTSAAYVNVKVLPAAPLSTLSHALH